MSLVFKTSWFNIDKFKYKKQDYYKINHNNAVLILAITNSNKIILIKQFRPSPDKKTLEFPSGNIEKNESALAAAKRELVEETGFISKKWFKLGKGTLRLERENSINYFFLALDCKFRKKTTEDIKTILVTKKKFKKFVYQNKIDQIAGYPLLIWANEKYKIKVL